MSILNQEKVAYAVQGFVMFLNISKNVQGMQIDVIEAFKMRAVDLMAQLNSGQLDPFAASLQLNRLISETNHYLSAPYPLMASDTEEEWVKGEIVAFEHYLKQELKANHLTLQQEVPLFNDSLALWEKVGTSLTAQQGVSEFSMLIDKLNQMLPMQEHYPRPDTPAP